MKKLLSLFVIVLSLFIACDAEEPEVSGESIGSSTEVVEDNGSTTSDDGVDTSGDSDNTTSDDVVQSEPVSDYEIDTLRREEVMNELNPVIEGEYRDWVSIDEIVTRVNTRVGGELVDEEMVIEIVEPIVIDFPDLYFGTWEELDNSHYPPAGWDRIFAIPDDGKLIFRTSD